VGIEIERKFLVNDRSIVAGIVGTRICQGYLSLDPERTVRVRLAGTRASITIKGISSASGITRAEYEYEIPANEAEELLDAMAVGPLIEKTRYRRTVGRLTWEVDVFEGENEGLVVAEVELPSEGAALILPDWIGEEVTGDPRYYNASLVMHPFREWLRD
jgi:CYTH domain-containing protein